MKKKLLTLVLAFLFLIGSPINALNGYLASAEPKLVITPTGMPISYKGKSNTETTYGLKLDEIDPYFQDDSTDRLGEDEKDLKNSDQRLKVSFEPDKYKEPYVAIPIFVEMRMQRTSSLAQFAKGDAIGYLIIRSYCFCPYSADSNGKFQNIIMYESEVCPVKTLGSDAKRTVKGYPKTVAVGIDTPNPTSRTFSPRSTSFAICYDREKTQTWNISGSITGEVSKGKEDGKPKSSVGGSATVSGGYSSTISKTISYTHDQITVSASKNDNAFCIFTWKYPIEDSDSISDKQFAAGTTYNFGIVKYPESLEWVAKGRGLRMNYEIRFGALIYSGKDEGKILTKGKETELSVEIGGNVFSY